MGSTPPCPFTNVVVLVGTMSTDPTSRDLRDGTVVNFDVTTPLAEVPPLTVPVAWHDPRSAAISGLGAGSDVLVVGTVRRRFFRTGGQTQSRTEVVAQAVVPTRRTKSVRSALAAVAAQLTPADGQPARSTASA